MEGAEKLPPNFLKGFFMGRVQSVFTYTLPATNLTTPPAAPIQCGCNDLVLMLSNRSLLKTSLNGILRVEIKSVGVSAAPVNSIDGSGGKVWKYDYTLEYNDTDLTDPAYRLRKCDIQYNCCYSCALAYADRQVEANTRPSFEPLRFSNVTEIGTKEGLDIWDTATIIKTLGASFTNNDSRPVWVIPEVETPDIYIFVAPDAGYGFNYDLDVVNDGVAETVGAIPICFFNNPLGSSDNQYITFPSAKQSRVDPVKVLPGDQLTVTVDLRIVPSGTPNELNVITLNGPWIHLVILPAD